MQQQYLYTLNDQITINECSVVGIIDGSGSMSQCWKHLCKAWNEFILNFKSAYCIQFDDTAILQKNPQLNEQKGEDTNIQLGFVELIKLIRSNQLLKQLIVVFVTDGVGEDKIEDYIDDLAKDFDQFHKDDYQIKFYTLAVGEDFSYQIVAELKNRIHNSNLISSQMEYILVPETDFKIKLDAIKQDVFYRFIKIQPPIQLVPDGKLLTKVVANQTIISTNSIININGQEIDLSKIDLTLETLDQFIRQIVAKLMEDNSRGIDVKQQALKQLEIVKQFYSQIKDNTLENKPIRDRINKNIDIMEQFAYGKMKFNNINSVDAAKLMKNLQEKNISIQEKKPALPTPVVNPPPVINPTPPRPSPPIRLVSPLPPEDYIEQDRSKEEIALARKKLDNFRRQVKTKPVFQDILKLYRKFNNKSPEELAKKAMERQGGAPLQQYVLEFQAESVKIFQLIHILKGEV